MGAVRAATRALPRGSAEPAACIAVEAGSDFGWRRWLREDGHFIGVGDQFGASPAEHLYEHFGITKEASCSLSSTGSKATATVALQRPDLQDFRPVGLCFAAALTAREPEKGPAALAFWTPPDALRALGVDWALDLQLAVADWHPDSMLIIDASEAPGFALQGWSRG